MSRSVNEVTLIGNVTKDAEVKMFGSGTKVSFSVATTKSWKDKTSGEWKEATDFHNIISWRGESVANDLTKGKQVYVKGSLSTRSYEKDGVKKYVTEIQADTIMLFGGSERKHAAGAEETWAAPADDDRIPF